MIGDDAVFGGTHIVARIVGRTLVHQCMSQRRAAVVAERHEMSVYRRSRAADDITLLIVFETAAIANADQVIRTVAINRCIGILGHEITIAIRGGSPIASDDRIVHREERIFPSRRYTAIAAGNGFVAGDRAIDHLQMRLRIDLDAAGF